MKKSAGKMFAKGFLISLLFFALFIGISTLSYRLVIGLYDIDYADNNDKEIIPPAIKETRIIEPSIDDISKHLIFCVDEDDGSIKKLILEIFNCEAGKLYYITIPIKTQFTLSSSLHRELVLNKPSIPQSLKLSAITGYFPKETAYEYGVLMIEELLNIQISYYSVVPQSIYETVFITENLKEKADRLQGSEKLYPREIFSDKFLEYIQTIKTEAQLRKYIEEIYTQIESNLVLEDKLKYMDSYISTWGKNVFFDIIAGEDSNSAFTIDEAAVAIQLESFMSK